MRSGLLWGLCARGNEGAAVASVLLALDEGVVGGVVGSRVVGERPGDPLPLLGLRPCDDRAPAGGRTATSRLPGGGQRGPRLVVAHSRGRAAYPGPGSTLFVGGLRHLVTRVADGTGRAVLLQAHCSTSFGCGG